ncbi:hypothetical protein [Paraburkholderia graminis]|uniref:hypothetical protein n=1 Tax=Paraburkholderia graminis TaxID=60548 RepID=UPI0038BD5DA3
MCGWLALFCDVMLAATFKRSNAKLADYPLTTVGLQVEFFAAMDMGKLVEGSVGVLGKTRFMSFVQGAVRCGGHLVARSSATSG